MQTIATTPELNNFLHSGCVVAFSLSGGKDSSAMALATTKYLDAIGHSGPRICIHAGLGAIEWQDSLHSCQRIAHHLGLDLLVVHREKGGMIERWEQRWQDNLSRYRTLRCVGLIMPWSSPSMRFCTSEEKVAPITAELVRRYPGQTIISVSGIRKEESTARSRTPTFSWQEKLKRVTMNTTGYDWHPILEWTTQEVFNFHHDQSFPLHNAYASGMTRVSCCFCILASQADLYTASHLPETQAVYRQLVSLETRSSFSFQSSHWLGDFYPEILSEKEQQELICAKNIAQKRIHLEAQIPKHLRYTKGWPHLVPTKEEAILLAHVRTQIAQILSIADMQYLTPYTIIARYKELLSEQCTKNTSHKHSYIIPSLIQDSLWSLEKTEVAS
jgi:3'-phosphoadenosine 5'-phosphosulfate sulfotransferase (PAPS reductase)/FAD synthetase